MKLYKLILVLLITVFCGIQVRCQIPAGYYDSAAGLTGFTLKTALYNIIKNHTVISYGSLYSYYDQTDSKPGNVVWDMYSDVPGGTPAYIYHHTSGDQCGTYNSEGDCYNREHSFPSSWFADASPMYSDLFNVIPTDGYVNNMRSNYALAEVGTPTWTSTNGSKLGNCSFPGWTNTVFEPIDEYKGDFARAYFYMATRYENLIAGWHSNPGASVILNGNNTTVFWQWYIDQLILWHLQDTVSTKETDRNNAVYAIQDNRNPYIDHPEWVTQIWTSTLTSDSRNVNTVASIEIYPNPASDKIRINISSDFSPEKINILDVYGRLIQTLIWNQDNEIDISNLSKGIYLLSLENKEKHICKRLIVE
jgi:endonuclease I